jgi:hypothetical protein
MEVGPVNHRIGIPESFPEVLIQGNVTDFFSRKRIHQTQTVDVNRVFPERSADSKEVETVEGIRGDLDPGSDFAEPFRLFQNQGMFPRLGQPKSRCQSSDPSAGYDEGFFCHILLSSSLPFEGLSKSLNSCQPKRSHFQVKQTSSVESGIVIIVSRKIKFHQKSIARYPD